MSGQIPKNLKPPEKSEALTVVVLLSSIIFLVTYFIFFSENKSFILKAKFTQADGLKSGAEVQCAGVKVGAVKEIRFLGIPEQNQTPDIFELILELSPTINGAPIEKVIHKDAVAVIIVVGALGDRGVNIIPGTPSSAPVSNGDYILGKIELTPAMVSANLQGIRKKFNELQAILEENAKWINEGKGNVGKYNKANNEAAVNLKKLLATTDTLEPLLEKNKGTLGKFRNDKEIEASINRLLDLADNLQEEIEKGKGTVGRFMQDEKLEKRVREIQERSIKLSERFQQVLERAQKGKGTSGQFLNNPKLKSDLKELEASVNKLSNKITSKRGTLYLIMSDPRLSENLSAISVEIAKLAYDIRQKPRKYVKFTLF
ncbi:MAG: MCE family protein [Acidobacteria bacterium]|nr:MCE family protein [Acidobacteriota bacterium]